MGDEKSTHPSLRPPLHGTEAEVPRSCSWALLDLYAYVADRANATSASGVMSDGTPVRVTLCAAPPPLVSYLCVWCPGLEAAEVDVRNTVLAAESDLLLLCVALRRWVPDRGDYFVYKAAAASGRPSLTLLPDPDRFLTRRHNITFLRHGGGGGREAEASCSSFRVAVLDHNAGAGHGHFDLRVLDSAGWRLTTRDVFVDCPYHHVTSKVTPLGGGGGGLLAFADQWRGIVVCDAHGRGTPRYLPLPRPLIDPDNCFEDPLCSRDIAFVGGRLTVVELRHVVDGSRSDSRRRRRGWTWEVSAWSRAVTHSWEEEWRNEHKVRSPSIAVDGSTANAELLPKFREHRGARRPDLSRLYANHPTISLSDANVVYVMAKVSLRDKKALVLAVDMSAPRVQGLAVFDAERMVGYTYVQSRIPGYFHRASGESVPVRC